MIIPFAPQLNQSTNQTDFLPESAESTKAAQLVEERFSTVSTDIPSIIVAQTKNMQKFSDSERQILKKLEEKIKLSKDIPIKNIISVFSLPEAKEEFESPAENTMTMIVNLSLGSFNDFETIPVEVKKLRDLVSNETKSTSNLTVLVGGPGGLFADFIQVFQSIDRLLLIVTIVLVFTILLIIYRSPITAILPLLIVASIFLVAQGIIAFIDQETGDFLKVNGQSTGIMTVVLFGSGTDYFLFISSRFKE